MIGVGLRKNDPDQKWWNYDFIKVKNIKTLGLTQTLAKTLIIARIGLNFYNFLGKILKDILPVILNFKQNKIEL